MKITSGRLLPTTVCSTTSKTIEIFPQDDEGIETTIILIDARILFLGGSGILAVWGAELGGDRPDILYVEKFDAGDVHASSMYLFILAL